MARNHVNLFAVSMSLIGIMMPFQNCAPQFKLDSALELDQSNSFLSIPSVIVSSDQILVNSPTVQVAFDIQGQAEEATCTLIETANTQNCISKSVSYNGLNDGDYTLEVALKNSGGSSTKRILIRKDTQGPAVSVNLAPQLQTMATDAVFAFNISDNLSGVNKVECSFNDFPFSKCTSPLNLTNLKVGSQTLRIRATDNAGNLSNLYSYSWLVQPQSSQIPTVNLAAISSTLTNKTSVTLTFTGTLASRFECSLDEGTFSLCISPKTYTALKEGAHIFNVRAVASDGSFSSVARADWTIDLTPPSLPTIITGIEKLTKLDTATFNFTSTDMNGVFGFECSLDNAAYAPCASTKSISSLKEGVHNFRVRAIDIAGNTSAATTYDWTIDISNPVLSLIQVPPGSSTETKASFTFEATDSLSGISRIQCSLDNGSFTDCSSPLSYNNLSVSQHSLRLQAIDRAGNAHMISYSWFVTTSTSQSPIATSFTCDPTAITCVDVVSTSNHTNLPVTFGQPFRRGDLLGTQGLSARDASTGEILPVQMDEVSSHGDGSIRFAVLSIPVKSLVANQSKVINLYKDVKKVVTPVVSSNPNWNLEIEAKVYNGNTVVSTLVAKPQEILKQQIANNSGRRLSGEVANEYTVIAPFLDLSSNQAHPHLNARLHTRILGNGAQIRTDMVIENNWTFKPNPSNITYELNVRQNGVLVYSQPKLTHYHRARWHKVLWTGAPAPQFRIRHFMPYFIKSRAILNYNLSLKVSENYLSSLAKSLAASNTKPMGNALLATYFPMTGARPEIGVLPSWTAAYIITQDDRAYASMIANADAAAGVSVHYRDENTGFPLDIKTHPDSTVRYDISVPAIPEGTGTTIFEPDRAHQASFGYMPYLITGDAFYLEEMHFWASWNMSMSDPGSRQRSDGLIFYEQTRGQAWALRSIGEAAFATPDNHFLKSHLKNVLDKNLTYYSSSQSYSPIGGLQLRDYHGALVPWQSDFMLLVFSWLAGNHEPKALAAANLIGKFQVGRFVNEANGFCPSKALVYDVSSTESNGQFITTFSRMFSRNFPSFVGVSCKNVPMNEEAYPTDPSGMSAMARASMAAAVNLGLPESASAYAIIKAMTPQIDSAFADDPAWAIVPE